MKTTANQHIDIPATDKELEDLRNAVPANYTPNLLHWSRKQQKDFYLGFVSGINAAIRVDMGKMTAADKRDYIKKLAIDAALIAGGFGKIIGG